MRSYIVLLCLLFSLLLPSSLASADSPSAMPPFPDAEAGRLFSIKGSNTVGARLAPAWVKDYMEAKGLESVKVNLNPSGIENEYRVTGFNDSGAVYYVDVAAHGSSTGFRALLDDSTDIAMSSRPIKDAEVAALAREGDMRSFNAENVVAIDGLAVIVNESNPIDALPVDTIAKIFSGEIGNWSEINGINLPINLYARDNNSGTWDTFNSLVLEPQYQLHASARRFESNDGLSDLVSRDPAGIGFVGLASVRNAKTLAVADGESRPLKPYPLYVATEDYPLARRLFMYVSPEKENPHVIEFLDYIHGDSGQERVQQIGFVSQNPVTLSVNSAASAPEGYREIARHAERLSVNFRFRSGSAELDNKAKQDILRLAEFIKLPANQDKKIQLIGFGDQKDSSSRALVLSQMRAIAVKSALYQQGVSTETIIGFGAYMPVASNSESGKAKNQRVEVWLYNQEVHELISNIKKVAEQISRSGLSDLALTE